MGFYDIEWARCYQISAIFSYRSQQVINRFFYRASADYSGALSWILEYFQSQWQAIILPMVSDGYTGYEYRILELFGDKQLDILSAVGDTGQDNGAPLPAFFGLRWRLYPSDTRIRKGRKILAGVTEAMVDGDTLNAAYTVREQAITALWRTTFNITQIDFTPVLLSPANLRHAGDLVGDITAAVFVGFSTQNSRKIGRGV